MLIYIYHITLDTSDWSQISDTSWVPC